MCTFLLGLTRPVGRHRRASTSVWSIERGRAVAGRSPARLCGGCAVVTPHLVAIINRMKVGEGQDFTSHRHVGSRLRMRRIMLETSEQQLGKAFIGCHAADLHCNTLRWWRMANNPGAQSCLLCYLRKYELAVLGPRDIRYSVVRRDRRFAFVRHLRSDSLNASTP